jgi:CBS domain-containing protein
MNLDEALDFLQGTPPFQDLDKSALRDLKDQITMESYPQGRIILHQGGPASEYLRVIRKGAVKVIIHLGQDNETFMNYRGEGDSFGFLSLISGDKSRAEVVALQDTLCYLINRATVLSLLQSQPLFSQYFLYYFLARYIDKPHQEMGKTKLLYGGADRLLFTTAVGELVSRDLVTASQDLSIQEATEIMSKNKVSSLVLLNDLGLPAGIITDKDLRDRVVSKSRDLRHPVKTIQSVSLVRAEAGEDGVEALFKMLRYNIHHLLVVDNGKLRGIVTRNDLLRLQGATPLSLVREIEGQQTIEGLIPLSKKIDQMIGIFLQEGARAGNITRIISEMKDRLLRRVLEINERRLGPPPLPYCWLALGSEGRKEQTIKSDHDNAVLFADPDSPAAASKARDYFSRLAALVEKSLEDLGYPPCPDGLTATNPRWCQSLQAWKDMFSDWVTNPDPEKIVVSLPIFDFRAIFGSPPLAEELREHLSTLLEEHPGFLSSLANLMIRHNPPLGLLRNFRLNKRGPQRHTFDLKFQGFLPLVDLVRLFALEKGIRETSTFERLQALKNQSTLIQPHLDPLEYALEFLLKLDIQHQYGQMRSGQAPDHRLDPRSLHKLEKKNLKESFVLIEKIQDQLIKRFRLIRAA